VDAKAVELLLRELKHRRSLDGLDCEAPPLARVEQVYVPCHKSVKRDLYSASKETYTA